MIVLNLHCDHEHKFEGWFRSAEDFANQKERGLVTCPLCGSKAVERLPSAPHVSRGRTAQPQEAATASAELHAALLRLVHTVAQNSEDVGRRFAEEARKIHRQEAPSRNIRGTTTAAEARELLDEGVPVLPLPLPPGSGMH